MEALTKMATIIGELFESGKISQDAYTRLMVGLGGLVKEFHSRKQ